MKQAKPPKISIYSEFHEFTRKQIKYFMETFKKFVLKAFQNLTLDLKFASTSSINCYFKKLI